MKKQDILGKIKALDINYFKLAMIALIALASFNFIGYLIGTGTTNNGNLEIALGSESSAPISIPVYFSDKPLIGKEVIIQTRHEQINFPNSQTNTRAVSDESMFATTDDSLPWFEETKGNQLSKLIKERSLAYGLLNPFLLVVPVFSFKSTEEHFSTDSQITFKLEKLFFDANKKSSSATIYLSSNFLANSGEQLKKLVLSTNNFNAFAFGFQHVQIDLARSNQIGLISETQEPALTTSTFFVNPCNPEAAENDSAQNCNAPLMTLGSSLIEIKALPASASFKLWRNAPESDSAEDLNFHINFEIGGEF